MKRVESAFCGALGRGDVDKNPPPPFPSRGINFLSDLGLFVFLRAFNNCHHLIHSGLWLASNAGKVYVLSPLEGGEGIYM